MEEGAKISEGQLLELLQTIEKHSWWFPSLDLGTWENVGSELEKLLCKGVPLPASIRSTWTLIKSVLEPLQTPKGSEGSEDECETPSEGGPEYTEPEGVEQAALPSVPLLKKEESPLPPLPPPPVLTAGAAQAFPSLGQIAVPSPLQKGIWRARQEG